MKTTKEITKKTNEKKIDDKRSNALEKNSKKLKDLDQNIIEKMKSLFKEYRCSKCFKKLIINIKRLKDNILYIITTCKNNLKETKTILDFLKENKFTLENDFDFYDLVPLNVRKKEDDAKKQLDDQVEKIPRYRRYYKENLFFVYETEIYLICFKCKKIFDIKVSQLDKNTHEHLLFKYYYKWYNNDDVYDNKKHFFKLKDLIYLERKIKKEKEYYNNLNAILIKYKLKDKYTQYLKEIESEFYFFNFYYNEYINQKTTRNFQNLCNVFNHKILPFKMVYNDVKQNSLSNNALKKDIENLNSGLISLYSLNTFNKEEKFLISDYEHQEIEIKKTIRIATELDESYFAAGGDGLYIYKIEKDNSKKEKDLKHKIILISKFEKLDIHGMIYLFDKKLIIIGSKGILLIKFNEDYKNYNILFHVYKNKSFNKIIKTYDNCFITFEKVGHITKWIINKNEDNIEKLFTLNTYKDIVNICLMNNKYFAYQTEDFIHIANYKTFKEHIKIEYDTQFFKNSINKLTDNIIGALSYNPNNINFFDIETGKHLFKMSAEKDEYPIFFHGFLVSKRNKGEIEIITLSEYLAYQRTYGYLTDWKLSDNNKLEKMSITTERWSDRHHHIYEMKDNTILISGFDEFHVLFYPS